MNPFSIAAAELVPLLAYELGRGNSVVNAGSDEILLSMPLDLEGATANLSNLMDRINVDKKSRSVSAGSQVLKSPAENPFAKGAAFVHGKFVPISEAKISIADWGYRRSDVTYDVVSVYHGAFFRLDDHLARFRRSMDGLRMKPKESNEDIAKILHELLRLSGLREAYVAMDCLRGAPPPGAPRHPKHAQPHIVAFAVPFAWVVPRDVSFGRGAHIITATTPRIPDACVDPTIKNFHWADLTRAAFEADDAGADNAILIDYEGRYLTEGPGFNLFLIIRGKVVTPERGCLLGVTRQSIIDLCDDLGIPWEIRHIHKEELHEADEVLLCTTAGGVMPVSRVDGKPIKAGDGPGPISCKLRDLFWEKRAKGWKATPIAYDD